MTVTDIERIKEMKDQAYAIATGTYTSFGETEYRWAVDVRINAMRAYAELSMCRKGKDYGFSQNGNALQ